MVITRIKGGLGNQLFQYAAGLNLSKRLNTDLYLDTSFYPTQTLRGLKLAQLNCQIKLLPERAPLPLAVHIGKTKLNKVFRDLNLRSIKCLNNWTYLLETPKTDLVPEFFSITNRNVYLDGYYQSVKYFSNIRKELVFCFTPVYRAEQEYLDALAYIERSNSVAIHVRRGDFQTRAAQRSPKHYLLKEKYYSNALALIEKKNRVTSVFLVL